MTGNLYSAFMFISEISTIFAEHSPEGKEMFDLHY